MDEISLAVMRSSRWKGLPPGAESEYEINCAYWESLTERQVYGLDPLPVPPWEHPSRSTPRAASIQRGHNG